MQDFEGFKFLLSLLGCHPLKVREVREFGKTMRLTCPHKPRGTQTANSSVLECLFYMFSLVQQPHTSRAREAAALTAKVTGPTIDKHTPLQSIRELLMVALILLHRQSSRKAPFQSLDSTTNREPHFEVTQSSLVLTVQPKCGRKKPEDQLSNTVSCVWLLHTYLNKGSAGV